ncbi:hypothetical protein DKX38_003749 [Salix brachista]|uniref:TF-B3 domain-containing protein n=1 Tax=Salix brachista TaxID=2182728 RepID=A0A5N5N8L8_9ROSI|nr:hypothetical protein DKX38_003749 [Salix brachista]
MEKIFTKKLSNIDIERRIVLSENLIKGFPRGHEAYLKFKDEDGKVWTFRCRVPPGGSSRPALSGDWFLFVRSKQLKVGDVIEIALDREKDRAGVEQFTIRLKPARWVSISRTTNLDDGIP